jgi:serine/threonine protein phosphatase PrpC
MVDVAAGWRMRIGDKQMICSALARVCFDVPFCRGIGSTICRALGDADLKDKGVTAEPQITEHHLQPADAFLILASDGLWDVLSNHDAVGLVHDTVKQPAMCAQR